MPNAFGALVHYLACLSVCLPPTWQSHLLWQTRQNSCSFPLFFSVIRCYIYVFSKFQAMCYVKSVSTIEKSHTKTRFSLHCGVMSCCNVLFEVECNLDGTCSVYWPASTPQSPSFSSPLFSSYFISQPFPLLSPRLFPNPRCPSLSYGFLPLHHRLATFSPFSPQPDGS